LIVVDASVAVEVLLATRAGSTLLTRILDRQSALFAPELMDVEVVQIVRRYQRLGELSAEHGQRAIDDLIDLPVERYSHRPLLTRMWELRSNLTAYDAAYVALAEALDAPLVTRDARLARGPHRARVEVV
jgi:predicted nucleic acid-binding protein